VADFSNAHSMASIRPRRPGCSAVVRARVLRCRPKSKVSRDPLSDDPPQRPIAPDTRGPSSCPARLYWPWTSSTRPIGVFCFRV